MSNRWDYVIVGAGSAGCAVAYELARSGRNSVCLLEAGGSDLSPYVKIPACQLQATKRFDWGYVSQPDPTRGGKSEPWTRGRILGGSGSINGMMYVRGAPHDFDRWAAAGNVGWSYSDVLPLYREMERSDQPGALRGASGPIHVRTVRRAHSLTDAFISAAAASGFPFNPDYNAGAQEGVSYAQVSQKRGLRCSSVDAFIRPLRGQKNFRLLLNAEVERIDCRSGTVAEVSFIKNGVRHAISARRVVLSAGAINSPKLLMLSGIGESALLKELGITPIVDAPEVGKNLQEHPGIRLIYKTRIPSNNLTDGLFQKLRILREFALYGQGPISSIFEACGFLKSDASLTFPDIQLHFLAFGIVSIAGAGSPLLNFPSVSVYINKNYPKSRGQIRLASADLKAPPLIDSCLLGDPDDRHTLVRGVRVVRKIMSASPMRELIEEEFLPGKENLTTEELENYLPTHTEMFYHPAGTCRMGADPSAVVTPELRVNGTENLWIADASVMPDLISGNTNAVCMMIGIKLGRYLSETPFQ